MSKSQALSPTISIGTSYQVPATLGVAPQPSQGLQPKAQFATAQTITPDISPSR